MSFLKKQNKLNDKINKFIVGNPAVLLGLPKKSLIIPVDLRDNGSFLRKSMKLRDKARQRGQSNILMAFWQGGDDWIFQRVLNFN